jgi:hypothetical protein
VTASCRQALQYNLRFKKKKKKKHHQRRTPRRASRIIGNHAVKPLVLRLIHRTLPISARVRCNVLRLTYHISYPSHSHYQPQYLYFYLFSAFFDALGEIQVG